MNKALKAAVTLCILFTSLSGCKKESDSDSPGDQVLPTVLTRDVVSITNSGFIAAGTVSSAGGSTLRGRGICWGVSPNPDITGRIAVSANGTGDFSIPLYGLSANTTYYLRAYATNYNGTSYGNQITVTTSSLPGVRGVFVAGHQNASGGKVARLFQNGLWSALHDSTYISEARSVYVDNNDVYVAGFSSSGFISNHATIWKNGVPTVLQPQSEYGRAYSVVVGNGDVYAAGLLDVTPTVFFPMFWKNGVGTQLSNLEGIASDVAIFGSDIYVAGYTKEGSSYNATIWKNGVATRLSSLTNSIARSFAFSGSDVYVSGYTFVSSIACPTYWKNGHMTVIPLTHDSQISSISVSGSDVYLAATVRENQTMAKVWKNGSLIMSEPGTANDILVSGSDVYVAGFDYSTGNLRAVLWKNGTITSLGDQGYSSMAEGIFLK